MPRLKESPGRIVAASQLNAIIMPKEMAAKALAAPKGQRAVEVGPPIFIPMKTMGGKQYYGTAMFGSRRLALDEVQSLQSMGFRVKLKQEKTDSGKVWVVWVENKKW